MDVCLDGYLAAADMSVLNQTRIHIDLRVRIRGSQKAEMADLDDNRSNSFDNS